MAYIGPTALCVTVGWEWPWPLDDSEERRLTMKRRRPQSVNGKLSPSSFSGDMMSFIFRPSASRSVSGSSLGAPPWNSDDLEEDEEECFLVDDDEEDAGRE
ncbi:hypothetical protein EYF80_031198 [Liparis tanakae]|uniref:Uncharacterized protein n=1 Tax=Liparis tanakae TaxID=230148 RepID=A0A4Z2GY92_9TELE|nr:hypothetical protein EYF80_031198 [Liparis tanakae]